MRSACRTIALPVIAVTVLGGCTAHHTAPEAGEATRSLAATPVTRPPIAEYGPCTAAELTGRLGVIGLGAGQYTRHLVLTNTSGRACTLTGGPSEITGVRRYGHQVRLASGASRGAGQLYGLVGPVNLQPGQSAQAVLRTTDMCTKAIEDRVHDFVALKIGIRHSGEVTIDFPHGRPYNAICGIGVSTFGVTHTNESSCLGGDATA